MVADFLTAVTSVKHILDVIASKDESLLEEVLRHEEQDLREEFGDDMGPDELEEFNDVLRNKREQYWQFLISDAPAVTEPGSSILAVQRIIDRDGLEVALHLDFNIGYRHVVWDAYRNLVGESLSHDALKLLEHLEARPFRGQEVEFDGSVYGWLASDEISVLHEALTTFAINDVVDESPDGAQAVKFHTDLVDALVQLRSHGCDGILVAC